MLMFVYVVQRSHDVVGDSGISYWCHSCTFAFTTFVYI